MLLYQPLFHSPDYAFAGRARAEVSGVRLVITKSSARTSGGRKGRRGFDRRECRDQHRPRPVNDDPRRCG